MQIHNFSYPSLLFLYLLVNRDIMQLNTGRCLIMFLISVLLFLSIPYIIYKTFFDKPYDPFPDQPDIHNPNDFNL
nr:MAG TPA: Photosystem II reaction centre N protein (psbN) [Caudoviricetes sp.]